MRKNSNRELGGRGGGVESVLIPGVTYLVKLRNNVMRKRYGNQLIKYNDEVLNKKTNSHEENVEETEQMSVPVMPDCRGVGESRIYSKRAKKAPLRDLSLNLASQVCTSVSATAK